MTFIQKALCYLLLPAALVAQSDRGTITGTVADPADAIVPNAAVSARNTETGALFQTVSTHTGNFTLPSLPAGTYDITVEVPGFKKYTRGGAVVQVAQVIRVDARLEVGSPTESITVVSEAPMLKTENAEQSTNVTGERINALPLNFGGGGGSTGAIRDPLAFIVLSPGVAGSGSGAAVNGFSGGSYRVLFEGQDSTSGNANARANETQGSVEMIEEFSLQTSNFAAEFGQINGGLVNFTARSGTNQYHGSAYEYLTNEALNAQRPFTYVNPYSRKHDFGFTVGGPVRIPKVYNGHNRTFFFFNFEDYRNHGSSNGTFATLPTGAMRNGDFSALLTGRQLGTDPLGRPILEGAIYDPQTAQTVNGQVVTNPFPGNIIPKNRFDPVAVKVQSLIPATTNNNLVTNWNQNAISGKFQYIPAVKIDHSISDRSKLAFYWSEENTHQFSNADGLPAPITAIRDQRIYSHTLRLNSDTSITPRFLVHAGAGYIRYLNPDSSPPSVLQNYDAVSGIGFVGGAVNGFPRIGGLTGATGAGVGSSNISGFGPTNANYYYNDKFTSVLSAIYVRNNHTFKLGGDFKIDIWTDRNSRGATSNLNFSGAETALPYVGNTNVAGSAIGFPYASFLLGLVDNATVNAVQDPQWRKHVWDLYLQDTWKVTRKLTLDIGLRWDLESEGHEIHYRTSEFGPKTPNPSAGGLPGALIYEGYGSARCNCTFAKTYPYAVGPRLGMAYQITPRTVFRAGWGLFYGQTSGYNYLTNSALLGVGFNQLTFGSPGFGTPGVNLSKGLQYNLADLYTASLNPGLVPSPGQINSPNYYIDPNGGRPPRIQQWNIGIQREIARDMMVELAYVGNRAVWLTAASLVNLNAIDPNRLKGLGFDITSAASRQILTAPLSSSIAQQAGFKAPYAGYPLGQTVAQTLRPFPQFGNISVNWSPLGDSWYDSLQAKFTKRYSHGLDVTAAFTWSKNLANPAGSVNNVFNRPNQKAITSFSQPFVFVTGFNYRVPGVTQSRLIKAVTGGWTVGGLLQYSSGLPIATPGSQNNLSQELFQNTLMNRVPGVPLYTKDLNCHCIDPNKDFVLNPAAWQDPAPGTWGFSAPYYNDFRFERRPSEQMSLGREFHFKERMMFQVRAEFFNLFNRTYLGNPSAGNPLQTPVVNSAGIPQSGYGRIDPTALSTQPRNGQLVARFQW